MSQKKGPVTRNTHTLYEIKYESLITYHSRGMTNMLKFLKSQTSRSNQEVKITVSIEMSCHKEYTYEIWKPCHLPFKKYGQC
jgi:hypothetical protein